MRIGVELTAENNSYCGQAAGNRDGVNIRENAQTGWNYKLSITPIKTYFLSVSGNCRDVPYNEIVFKKIKEQYDKGTCSCRPPNHYLCKYMKYFENVPICKNKGEEKCYKRVRNIATKDVPLKPCTKLEYKHTSTPEATIWEWPVKENALIFSWAFPYPPKATVKEEYLICDTATLIGVIGGSLGLFIGISFIDIYIIIIKCFLGGLGRFFSHSFQPIATNRA